ncbi:MAG: winged helix-turn-helix domain-containing protein [Planctomycetes bacterium]|nr:winged helix-turn-helix domain-containing protein [Planctomycetota bacterium]
MSGWFCVWRKIEEDQTWSRGMEYRGLMITILQKTNWKKGFFLGDEIQPGQFATSAGTLAKELKISRQKCQRMVSKLEQDGFVTVQNMSNRYTLITVVNWDRYQSEGKTGEQRSGNDRATIGQRSGTIEQGNKETIKEKPLSDLPAEPVYKTKKKRILKGKRLESFELFWDAFDYKSGKAAAADSWHEIDQLTDTLVTHIVSRAKLEAGGRPEMKKAGRTPKMAQGWITERRWEDETQGENKNDGLSAYDKALAGGRVLS